jgi:hypothetical protein
VTLTEVLDVGVVGKETPGMSGVRSVMQANVSGVMFCYVTLVTNVIGTMSDKKEAGTHDVVPSNTTACKAIVLGVLGRDWLRPRGPDPAISP